MPNAIDVFEEHGLIEQISDEKALRKSFETETLSVYVGFDPTSDSLHLGHLLPILCLARLQKLGHKPITLVGGATGMIGDPSGKSDERNLLTQEVIESNSESIKKQLERFLDFDCSNSAEMVNNIEWTNKYSYIEWLRDVGKHFSVNSMLNKESVRRRIEDNSRGISYTEFSYMLIQANDFLELYDRFKCTLQVGGNDQWGNITAGIDLIHRKRHEQAYGITFPLLESSSGEKFGKTEGNAIWLDPEKTSAYSLYQYWIGVDDRDAIRFLKYFTFLSMDDISDLEKSVQNDPGKREAQHVLADESTRMIHGEDGLQKSIRASEVLFGGEINDFTDKELIDIFADVPSSNLSREELNKGIGILTMFTKSGLSKSNGQALQLLKQGGVYVNNVRMDDQKMVLSPENLASESIMVLRGGKKRYHMIRIED
ncbi:tyrosine--tRNA ligase [Candidatus Latescibacterota bacterium]